MAPRYRVTLTQLERDDLEKRSTTGTRAAKTVLYARALLLLDAGEGGPKWQVSDVAQALGMVPKTLERLKRRFVEEGLEASLQRKERESPPRKVIFDGDFEAKLLSIACSEAPPGRTRWTVRLLAEKLVELKIVPSVSAMTVCNTLKKTNFDLTCTSTGKSRRMATRAS
ncbi:MAG: helix-turn-helix domain-containing protein [Candidatus Accumulibacter sp.]|jgi:transposase|nr:helix-turn-helix domain-containing protein [Accumulibacter sp.]